MSHLTVGIIGAGRIGRLHAENMLKMPNVTLKTIADPYAETAQAWADSLQIHQLITDYQELINDPQIDAVFICSPTNTHVEIIKAAALAQKHIFCEKPISFSEQESLEAYQLVKAANIVMQVGFNRRFDHNYARIQKGVATKQIGDLQLLKITSRDPEPPSLAYIQQSGGLFMDMSIHDFDMARFIVGAEVTKVYATGAALINPQIANVGDIDTALIQLTFENGALGIIDNSRQAVYGYDQRLEAFGSKGSLESQNDRATTVKLAVAGSVRQDPPLHFFLERYQQAYIQEVEAFLNAIREQTPPLCSFEDGIMAQRIATAALASLKNDQPVTVSSLLE